MSEDNDNFDLNVALIKASVEEVIAGHDYAEAMTALLELVKRHSNSEIEIEFIKESLLGIFPEVFRGFD